ncbi:MAG: CsbD family protein [Candidatus Sericytochromatia bacterium]
MAENRDMEMQGMGNQVKGKARELWGRLSGKESDVTRGKVEQTGGKVQEHLGRAANEIERKLDKREHRP